MAIATTSTFNLDIAELAEEAFERAGSELRSGLDLRTARRSLNLITLEWQNRGINLWCVEEITYDSTGDGTGTTTLVKGTSTYNLRTGTISLLDVILRTDAGSTSNQTDYQLNRISQNTYSTIPNKLNQARPIQYHMNRQEVGGSSTKSSVTLWPVPDTSAKYTLVYWRIARIADAGDPASNDMDVPARFLPALVAGLAYHIALKKPELAPRAQMLKGEYEQQFALAAAEDREKAPIRFVPGGYNF